jgi:hypothetical protein
MTRMEDPKDIPLDDTGDGGMEDADSMGKGE